MKYHKTIIFCLTILVLSLSFYYSFKNTTTQVEEQALKTQSIEIGEVTYKITPKKIKPSDRTWDFQVILDAHSGSLDQDVVTLISIADNKGNEYKAIKWVGDSPGGHHREGILEFLPITPYPTYIELKIQTTNITKKNTLRWDI